MILLRNLKQGSVNLSTLLYSFLWVMNCRENKQIKP